MSAKRAFHALRSECVELYNKEWSPYQIMDESHRILDRLGVPRASNIRSRILTAVWNICPRQGMPSINDMLAVKEQFDIPEDTPALEEPWWKHQ